MVKIAMVLPCCLTLSKTFKHWLMIVVEMYATVNKFLARRSKALNLECCAISRVGLAV